MLNIIKNTINRVFASGVDSDASAFITAAGLTDATQKDAINTLVKDMKAAGLWSKMKAVYPMVGGTATSMKFNLKDPRDLDAAFRLTWSGGWTYSATGATPNGTNAYADTKLVASTAISSINSSHLSIYSRTDTASSPQGDMGAYTSTTTNAWTIAISYSDICYMGSYAFGMAINYNQFANTNSTGYYINTRSAANAFKSFRNNELKATNTTLAGTLPTVSQYIGAENNNGTAVSFSTKQYAFATLGDGLSDSDALLLNQIVEKYQVALSRGVQAAQSFYYNSAYSNEANTYLYSTQITGTTQVSAINTLINGLKANNLWAKMKAVYPFVTDKTLQADMAAQMKFNLVNPQDTDAAFRLAFSGGWTYSTNGAQPNGTNGYADTKLVPSTSLSTSSAHFSKYNRTNDLVGNKVDGSIGGTSTFFFQQNYSAGNGIIGEVASIMSYTPTDTRGLFTSTRTSTSLAKQFRNSNQVASATTTITGMSDRSMFIGARNDATITFYNSYQAAFSSIGDGLSDAEAALLYQLVQEFQTTLSRQV